MECTWPWLLPFVGVSPLHLLLGQTEATISYAGLAPNAVGLYQFNVVVPNVSSSDAIPLTLTLAGTSRKQTLYIAVQNGALATQIQSLTLSANSVSGGGSVQGTAFLSAAAPAGGAIVSLSSNSAVASVPATVTVTAGSASVTFNVPTSTVSANQSAIVTANYIGSSAQATLTITPPLPPLLSFSKLYLMPIFQATGYTSTRLSITVAPENGLSTFSVDINAGPYWSGCIASNQNLTYTCNDLFGPFQVFGWTDGPSMSVSNATMVVSLVPDGTTANGGRGNTLSGTLSATGKTGTTGTVPISVSGPLTTGLGWTYEK